MSTAKDRGEKDIVGKRPIGGKDRGGKDRGEKTGGKRPGGNRPSTLADFEMAAPLDIYARDVLLLSN